MRLILFLLKTSWRLALVSSLIGGASGAASVAVVVMIQRTVEDPNASSATFVSFFTALCLVVLLTRIVSQWLVARLTQSTMLQLQMGLCRRILDTPIKQLEAIGSPRMLAALSDDVTLVTRALSGVPLLGVNVVILLCGFLYLGSLSLSLLVATVVFCVCGVASYWYAAKWAGRYADRARESRNSLQHHVQELIAGVKELKMHSARRQEFVEDVLFSAAKQARHRQYVGDTLQDAAVSWGRFLFFVALGLLLFVWPRVADVNSATLTAYVLTFLYLMSPLEQILGWLPYMNWAAASVRHIDRLGFMLDEMEPEASKVEPLSGWTQIEFEDVTHSYQSHDRPHGFELGPINLTIHPGEIVFLTGGNGSGKTTLAKLITGLYLPESGDIRLDGKAITGENRESYRQLFSAVFDDAMVFDSLWGLNAADRDRRAHEYLEQLDLAHVVTVADGEFSTTALSRGQRKRLALLTAYLEDRPIYVFDEWAADQDPEFRKVFYLQLLPDLKRLGKTVIAITHDDRYFDCADRVFKFEEGHVAESPGYTAPIELISSEMGDKP